VPSLTGLSAREVEVLRLLAVGQSNQQIADEFVISLNTVNRHVSNIYAKIDAENRAQAAVYAKEHGIV
jgi:two-component system, NarL family, response regulator LiaR